MPYPKICELAKAIAVEVREALILQELFVVLFARVETEQVGKIE